MDAEVSSISFQRPTRYSTSASSSLRLRPSAAVRQISPAWLGRSSVRIFLRRDRSSRSTILRETPACLSPGMRTRYRPGMESRQETFGPLVPIGSLITWTITSWPFFKWSWMFSSCLGSDERAAAESSRSNPSKSMIDSRRSLEWRKAVRESPRSRNAAWMPGKTALTTPL